MKINKPTSVALLGRWLAKQYSTEWILPQIDCQVVDILQLTRIDQQKEVETERKRLIKEHTSS